MTILDRFEGELAVIETDDGMIQVCRSEMPDNVSEGDVLVCCDGVWTVDMETTEERRRKIREKLRGLMRKNDD